MSFLGKKHTEETKAKMRQARKKQVFSDESKKKMSENRHDVRGKNNPNWNGGEYLTCEGYIMLSNNGNRKLKHRYIAEQTLERPLEDGEIVHHIDGDKLNNDPDNLFVCTMSVHRKLENHFAHLYKQEHFNSDESRSEFVKMYGNLGTDKRNALGKATGYTVS